MKQAIKKKFPWLVPFKYLPVFFRHPQFLSQFFKFRNDVRTGNAKPLFKDIIPYVNDKTALTVFDTHYIYHPAWAARIVKKVNPAKHIDISSTLHFCAQLSAFIPTEFYDYRPANLNLSDLTSGTADLCKLHFNDNEIESLSCMHTVEHIGLGRYGDPIDAAGDQKAISELQRVVSKGGNLLFVTPVGKPKIVFNAHRVYAYKDIIRLFDKMELVEFSLIPDNALQVGIISHADPALVQEQEYGCGCFWFRKR
jgi:Caenorhabditis protein of unknown function, DUF268